MPNVLGHVGAQGPLSDSLFRDADPRWVLLGCVTPDVAWITQRGLRVLAPGLDAYDLRLYAIIQASFLFCLILASAFAALARRPRKALAILIVGSILHLLLDAAQTRWGNGVHFIAPFSWRLVNFGLFWPEHVVTIALTLAGLLYFAWIWRAGSWQRNTILSLSAARFVMAAFAAALYVGLPVGASRPGGSGGQPLPGHAAQHARATGPIRGARSGSPDRAGRRVRGSHVRRRGDQVGKSGSAVLRPRLHPWAVRRCLLRVCHRLASSRWLGQGLGLLRGLALVGLTWLVPLPRGAPRAD